MPFPTNRRAHSESYRTLQPFGAQGICDVTVAFQGSLGLRVILGCLNRLQVRYGGLLGILPHRDFSEELLRRGLAVVYRESNAAYDGPSTRWDSLETQAKENRVGIWGLPLPQKKSPAEYKRELRRRGQEEGKGGKVKK